MQMTLNAQTYRDQMQRLADQFVDRHQGEHLDEGQLFERTCRELVNRYEVPLFMAERMARHAITRHTPPKVYALPCQFGGRLMLVDQRDGRPIPIRKSLLPAALTPIR